MLDSPTLENLKTWRFAADVTRMFTVTYPYEVSGTETEEPTISTPEQIRPKFIVGIDPSEDRKRP